MRESQMDQIREQLAEFGVRHLFFSSVMGFDTLRPLTQTYRNCERVTGRATCKVEVLATAEQYDDVVRILRQVVLAQPGSREGLMIGYSLSDAIQFPTGEQLEYAVR